MKDCTTCKYGYKDERLGIPMCHHPKRFSEDCVDFNMHEEKESNKQQPTKWNEDDEKMLDAMIDIVSNSLYEPLCPREGMLTWLKSLRPQHRDYAITFWTYLDEHRPEGKMCLSNGECADIEKAFVEHDWAKILRYAKKYLSPKELIEGDKIIECKVGMHGEPIKIVLDKYAQRARGIFPGDELMVILRTKR